MGRSRTRTPHASATALAMGGRHRADAAFADRFGAEGPGSHRVFQEHGGERRDVANRRELEVAEAQRADAAVFRLQDRKSTRLNSSHSQISYAVFCLKKKKKQTLM